VRTSLFAGLFAAGLLVRILALPLPGTEDVNVWKVWSYAASSDVTSVYGIGGDPPVRGMLHYGRAYTTVDYPPVALYELALAGLAYRAWLPDYPNTWTLTAFVKLPGLLAGIGLTALLYVAALGLTRRRDLAQAAALAYWWNPATMLNAEVLGYLDPLMMLPALAAFVLLHRRQFAWAGVCLAVAALTKPQAVLIAPAFALALWQLARCSTQSQSQPLLASVGAAALAAVVIVAPYLWVGALRNMWLAFGSFTVRRDILSGDAANVWWIANYVSRAVHMVHDLGWRAWLVPVPRVMAISTFMSQGIPDPRPFGQLAVLTLWAWALWRLRHTTDLGRHLLCAAFLVHAFFVLAVGVHEHHQMLMVPLLALAAVLRPRLRPLFAAVSVICTLNMNLFYGVGRGAGWAVPRGLTLIDATVVLSVLNIAALIWHAVLLARESQSDALVPILLSEPSSSPHHAE
jgi:Gpi18-like mannosyltransferase